MAQTQQSVFIKEECDINWNEEDNVYEDLVLEKIKIDVDSPNHHISSEINAPKRSVKFEKVEAQSPSHYIPPETNDTSKQLDKLEKKKLEEECLSNNSLMTINPLKRCPKCGIDTENFHDHFTRCEEKSFVYCVYCPYKVNTAKARTEFSLLFKHIKRAHLERKPMACYKCGSLVKRWYLPYHLKICGGESEDHCCDHCSFQTKHMTSLRRHIKYNHSGGDVISCPECKKKLTSQGKLSRHLFYCKNKRQLSCEICNYTTKKRKFFKKHVLISHFF